MNGNPGYPPQALLDPITQEISNFLRSKFLLFDRSCLGRRAPDCMERGTKD